jgi:hypothetical protein
VLRCLTTVAVERSRDMRISTEHHTMYESVSGRRIAKERALAALRRRFLCTIVYAHFREFSFHALP